MVLAVSLLLGTVSVLGSCGLFSKKSNGTLAAKLLLANERLDENLVGKKIDVGLPISGNSKVKSTKSGDAAAILDLFTANSSVVMASKTDYTWSNFPAFNSSLYQFESFILNIDTLAFNAATDISTMKDKVGVVDKWVGNTDFSSMLRVYESRDVLLSRERGYESAYYRYTDENANNVYDMYSFSDHNGEYGEVKMLLIPGERYEYFYNHSSGFRDYVIMENSRGYWVCTRFNCNVENDVANSAYFETMVVKDGLAYGVSLGGNSQIENGKIFVNPF